MTVSIYVIMNDDHNCTTWCTNVLFVCVCLGTYSDYNLIAKVWIFRRTSRISSVWNECALLLLLFLLVLLILDVKLIQYEPSITIKARDDTVLHSVMIDVMCNQNKKKRKRFKTTLVLFLNKQSVSTLWRDNTWDVTLNWFTSLQHVYTYKFDKLD